jgi:hypothetical protein
MSKNSLVRRKKKVTKVTKVTNVTNETSTITKVALKKLIADVDNIAKKFLKTKKGKVARVAGGAGGAGGASGASGDKGNNYYDQVKKLIIDNKDKIKKLKENLIYEIFVNMTRTPDRITSLINITKDSKDINRDRAKKFLDIITDINSLDQTHINNIITVSSFSSFSFNDKLSTLVMINILIGVYNSKFFKDFDKIDKKDIKFELNKGEEKLIKYIKNVYENSDDISYDLLRFYNDLNRVKNKYELIIDIDNLSQLDHSDSNYNEMVSSVVNKFNSKIKDTNNKLEEFKGYISANDFKEDSIVSVLSSENINKKIQYYNGIKKMFRNFKKEIEKENKIYYGISKIDVVTDKNINDCVEEYKNKNTVSYSKSLNQLYYILDNECKIYTYLFKRKRLEEKDVHMKDYMKNYMTENYKEIKEINFDNITPFKIIDEEHNYLIVKIEKLCNFYNQHISNINYVINSKSLDDILKHNNKLITFRDNYFKNISILLDNIKEKYRDNIKIYISACNSSTQSSKQDAMDVLYELLHKINIANFDELVTIKDIFKSVEDIFKKKCIPNIGFDTKNNTDELINIIANYNLNKLVEMRLNTKKLPDVVQEVHREAKKSDSNASTNVVTRLIREGEEQSEYDHKNVISDLKEQFELGKKVKRVPFNPFQDLPAVPAAPTYVQEFKGFNDLTPVQARAAAAREVATAAATRKGGKLAANYKSYKSTGKFVYILYKKKRIKRCVYVKAKGRGKYCKIDKEYILLSKLKVV